MTTAVVVEFSGSRSGVSALSWGQVAIWRAIQRMVPDDAALNMSWVTDLEGEGISTGTPLSRITDTVRTVMERHESLRTRVRADADGAPRQVLAAAGTIEVQVVDATAGTATAAAKALQERLTQPAYDYPHEWPLRVGAVRVGDVVTHAVFGICHLVTDRGGLTALVRDVVLGLRGEPSRIRRTGSPTTRPCTSSRQPAGGRAPRRCGTGVGTWKPCRCNGSRTPSGRRRASRRSGPRR
ncbi:condensation domain-containing protein [Dactylosporangium cerinum]